MEAPNNPKHTLLFRHEVLAEQQSSHMGQVLIHQPVNYAWVALSALLLVILVLAFLLQGTHTRKVAAPGLLVPDQGVLRILAPNQGQVLKVSVKEGDSVKAGDPLFVLSGERVSLLGEVQTLIAEQMSQRQSLIKRDIEQSKKRLVRQQEFLDMRLGAIEIEKSQLQEEMRLLEEREQLALNNVERMQRLRTQGHIAVSELQQAKAERLALSSQKQSIKRNQVSLEHDRLALIAQHRTQEEQYQRQLNDANQSMALLQQEIAENNLRTQQIIQAPFDGQITGLSVQAGQRVVNSTLMTSLVPSGSQLHAQLYITPRQSGFIQSGQQVTLRYEAFPYQKFGMAEGRVVNVANSPYSINELQPHIASTLQSGSNPGASENYYRVTVELESQHVEVYGRKKSLLPGMQLEADILQEERKIYEWILEPLYSFTEKM